MIDFIIGAVLIVVIGLAARFVRTEQKNGVHCVGCPHARDCARRRNGAGCGRV